MKEFIKQRQAELLITLFTAIACFVWFTPTYEDYGYFLTAMASGQFCDFNFIDLHYLGFVGVSAAYKFLYHLLPQYNWMGIGILVFDLLGLYLLLRLLRMIVLPQVYLLRFLQLLFVLFYIENIIQISHTRFSLMFCGIALFNLVFYPDGRKRTELFYAFLFLLGMLHRPESSMGMLLVVGSGFLLDQFNVWHVLKNLRLPLLFTAVFLTVVALNWSRTTVFMEKVEPEIEYKMMDKRMVGISTMKTAVDSVKYEVAANGMWFDPEIITTDFLRSLLLPGINLSPAHAAKVFFHLLKYYQHYVFIAALWLLYILPLLSTAYSRRLVGKLVLFQVVVFAILYVLDFNGRLVAERHFLPVQLMAAVISLYILFESSAYAVAYCNGVGRATGHLCLLLALAAGIFTVANYKAENCTLSTEIACYEKAMQQVESKYAHRTIVNTISNIYLLNHNFSFYARNYTNCRYLMYDVFTFSLIPEYTAYLNRTCGCDALDPVTFYTWLAKQNALYMCDPPRFDLTERYMNLVHALPLRFVASPDSLVVPSCMSDTHLHDFELRNVVIADSLQQR